MNMFTPPYRQLGLFAGNFAMGIESALTMPRAFSIALRSLSRTPITRAMIEPVETVRSGTSIADTLRQAERHLPSFVIPTIQAGEETGRLEESLRFLERHCHMLSRSAIFIRNAWLVPLSVLFVGDTACIVLNLAMGSIPGAANYLLVSAVKWAVIVALIGLARRPQLKPWLDRVRLRLPWYGSLERDMGNHRFFRVMSLLFGVSATPVDRMIETAAASVSNTSSQREFLKAAAGIRSQDSIAEAFRRSNVVLDETQQASIAAGEEAGKLDAVFAQLAETTETCLQRKLTLLEQVTYRVATFAAVTAIVGVVWNLASH